MFKRLCSTAIAAALGLVLSPAVGSAQMMNRVSPNVSGIAAGANYYPYRSGGFGPGYYGRPFSAAPAVSSYYTPSVSPILAENVAAANIEVRVPADAEIWFDGAKTSQKGTARTFVSPSLPSGQDFTYDIRARWNDNGTVIDQTRHVQVQAGRRSVVDFLGR